MPDLPNPVAVLGAGLGDSLASVAASAFDQAMKSLWDFSLSLLNGVLGVLDHLTVPDLHPGTGPLSAVLPSTIWVGGVLLVVLSLLQVGRAAMTGGAGLAHLFKGIAQYVVISAAALGILATLVTAADAAARGILATGLNTTSWAGVSTANTPWQNAVHGVSGAGLGLIALLGVLPAAIGLMAAALVREASILVIAATIPILAAGLVAEATARWFWTGLRWMLALIMLTPAVAIVLSIGFRLAASTGTGAAAASSDTGQEAVTAFVGAAVLLISVFCPLALFKLFAFIDPGTPSGHALRTSLSDIGARAQTAPAQASAATPGPAGTARAGSGPTAAVTAQESATSDAVDSRWAGALSRLSAPHRVMAAGTTAALTAAAPVLEAAGVGAGANPGQPPPYGRTRTGNPAGRRPYSPGPSPDAGPDPSPNAGSDSGSGSSDGPGTDPAVSAALGPPPPPSAPQPPDPPRPPDPPPPSDPPAPPERPGPAGGGGTPRPAAPGGGGEAGGSAAPAVAQTTELAQVAEIGVVP